MAAIAESKAAQKAVPNLRYQRDRDRELVRGIFRNYENPGGFFGFVTKFYKEDPVERWEMWDGQEYTVPRIVARHLNTNVAYPEHHYLADENGNQVARVKQMVRRCGFQSLEFTELEDVPSKLVQVEKMARI